MFQDHHTQEERLVYDKPCNYTDKTLIGPWVDDRARYVKKIHQHPSSVSCDYPVKPVSYVHPNVIWNAKIRAEGYGPRIMMDHERTKYHNNFSTTYDLSYNYIPKICKTKQTNQKSNLPHETRYSKEIINNFGNVTHYGLLDYKKVKWKNELIDPEPPLASESRIAYQAYKKSDYCCKRFAPNKHLSSKTYSANDAIINNPPRGVKTLLAPDNILLPVPTYPSCPLRIPENPCKTKLLHEGYKLKELIT